MNVWICSSKLSTSSFTQLQSVERDSIAICRDKRSAEEIRVYPRTEQPLWDSLLSFCFPSGHLHRALSLVNCRCASPALHTVKRFISRESPRHRPGGADPHSPQTSPHFFSLIHLCKNFSFIRSSMHSIRNIQRKATPNLIRKSIIDSGTALHQSPLL